MERCRPPRKMPLLACYHAKFGRSRLKGTTICTEIREKNGPLGSRHSRSLKVIGTDADRSAMYDFLLAIHDLLPTSRLYNHFIVLSLSLYFTCVVITVLVFFFLFFFFFYYFYSLFLGILLSLYLLCCCIVLPSGVIKNNNNHGPISCSRNFS